MSRTGSLVDSGEEGGMVRFTLEPKEKVGLFVVRKDDGLKQRLIVDARRSNLRFSSMSKCESSFD